MHPHFSLNSLRIRGRVHLTCLRGRAPGVERNLIGQGLEPVDELAEHHAVWVRRARDADRLRVCHVGSQTRYSIEMCVINSRRWDVTG